MTSEWPSPEFPDHAPFVTEQVEAVRTLGAAIEVLPFRGGGRPRAYIEARARVSRRLRSGAFDLVHGHYGQSGLTIWPTNLPTVVTFHGSDLMGIVGPSGRNTAGGWVLRQLSRLVAVAADEVILHSDALARKLPRRVRYEVIPMGVDFGVFRPRPKIEARRQLGLPSDRKLVLFSGSPDVPVKRYGLARSAVAQLPDELKVDLVTLAGRSREEVALMMSACDVLLVTSSHEGGPLTVKEALACDLPVVSVDVGDVRRWIRGLEGCVLCDDSPASIGEGLTSVLGRTVSFEGRRAVEELRMERIAERVMAVYSRAVARQRQRL